MDITVNGFDALGRALDSNNEVIRITNGETIHILKEAVLQEPDKLVAEIESINDNG